MASIKAKRLLWAVSFTVVTISATLFGAGLKQNQQVAANKRQLAEATPAEKIKVLEEHRGGLVAKRNGVERKIEEIRRRTAGMSREESMQGRERKRNW